MHGTKKLIAAQLLNQFPPASVSFSTLSARGRH